MPFVLGLEGFSGESTLTNTTSPKLYLQNLLSTPLMKNYILTQPHRLCLESPSFQQLPLLAAVTSNHLSCSFVFLLLSTEKNLMPEILAKAFLSKVAIGSFSSK